MGWKEQGKKRYNKLTDVEGLSPTLRPSALMKNSQENIIVNQPKKEKEIQTPRIAPTILKYSRANKKNEQGKIDITYHEGTVVGALKGPIGNQQNFVVSGQTSGISTQPKSTGKGSGIKKKKSGIVSMGNIYKNPKTAEAGEIHHPIGISKCLGGGGRLVGMQKRGKTISPNEIYPTLQSKDQRKFNANQSTLVDTGTNPQNSTKETSEQLILLPYQNTPSSVRDFLAKVSVLLGSEADLQILEAHSSMKLCESLGLKEPRIYSLRTSKDSSPTTGEEPLGQSFKRWMNLGMTASGKCLTARISPSRRTGSECSLSQILEENPDPKYYLSEKQVKYIQNQMDKSPTPLTAIITKDG